VTAIDEIASIIGQISDYQTTIASAVEEQSVTTAEMNRGVAEAATGSNDIATTIVRVAEGTSASRSSATVATRAAQDVRALADGLEKLVARFSV
jgi:methyl-accepting chemotaxis protein